jgi:hypothetical protein
MVSSNVSQAPLSRRADISTSSNDTSDLENNFGPVTNGLGDAQMCHRCPGEQELRLITRS